VSGGAGGARGAGAGAPGGPAGRGAGLPRPQHAGDPSPTSHIRARLVSLPSPLVPFGFLSTHGLCLLFCFAAFVASLGHAGGHRAGVCGGGGGGGRGRGRRQAPAGACVGSQSTQRNHVPAPCCPLWGHFPGIASRADNRRPAPLTHYLVGDAGGAPPPLPRRRRGRRPGPRPAAARRRAAAGGRGAEAGGPGGGRGGAGPAALLAGDRGPPPACAGACATVPCPAIITTANRLVHTTSASRRTSDGNTVDARALCVVQRRARQGR